MQVEEKADPFGRDHRKIVFALGLLIAAKVIVLFVLAWNSRFVMDEFAQLGWAKYLGHGLFETIWPAKAAGATAFYKLAHLSGWDAQSILLIGRMQTALLGCGTLAMIYGCARALGESRVRALAIVFILLCFSNFIERIFRTIAEPLALFFAVAALLVVLRGQADKPRTILAAGILSGLAFLATQKSLYFNLALGLGLLADAALARHYLAGIRRGVWLVLGWIMPIIVYCFIFGGTNPLPIAQSLVFGPVEVATLGGGEYGGLRHFVLQTLLRNPVLYAFCFAGMALSLLQFAKLDERRRIALVFTWVITLLVFTHDQPWPYVFIMALPFMALWSLVLLDHLAANPQHLRLAWVALLTSMAISFVSNLNYLRIGNANQLELVRRAEALLGPDEVYFDGIGMLPNRREPSTLWIDQHYRFKTIREGKNSEAYRIFANSPPKLIIWSYRMNNIASVVGGLIQNSYVRIAPNIRMAGRRLDRDEPARFDVPLAGRYRLYSAAGAELQCRIESGGTLLEPPLALAAGAKTLTLRSCPADALLLPEGSYAGLLKAGGDNDQLFDDVYK